MGHEPLGDIRRQYYRLKAPIDPAIPASGEVIALGQDHVPAISLDIDAGPRLTARDRKARRYQIKQVHPSATRRRLQGFRHRATALLQHGEAVIAAVSRVKISNDEAGFGPGA